MQVFTNDGTFLTAIGSFGPGDDQFDAPAGIAVDAGGRIIVSDFRRGHVQVFEADGTFLCPTVNGSQSLLGR